MNRFGLPSALRSASVITAGRGVQQEHTIGPAALEVDVVPALVDQTVNQRQRQGAVGAGAHLQEHVGTGADADAARINHHGFHAAPARLDDIMGEDQRRRARIVPPE